MFQPAERDFGDGERRSDPPEITVGSPISYRLFGDPRDAPGGFPRLGRRLHHRIPGRIEQGVLLFPV